jgi:hypothetical protein
MISKPRTIKRSPHGQCPRCGHGLARILWGLQRGRAGAWEDLGGCMVAFQDFKMRCTNCEQGLAGRPGFFKGPQDRAPWPNWDSFQWALLVQLAALGPALSRLGLDLPLPQFSGAFSYGPRQVPLPAGAVLRLWAKDAKARSICAACGGPSRAISVGGGSLRAGYACRCLHCGATHFEELGRLTAVATRLRHYLEGTPWYLNGGRLGAFIGDPGFELAAVLGMNGWEGVADEAAPWGEEVSGLPGLVVELDV